MDTLAPLAQAGSGAPVELRGISKEYGPHRVIDGLDLDIRSGEFITLLGASGSGKTTTLMLIAGFERPSRGTIRIGGTPVEQKPPHTRNIGMVFQSYALFPHMNVAENIAFPLKQRGIARAEREQAVGRMLDLVQLPGLAGRFPQQLSGGQQQRVAIARAIVFNPQVLLMDEPLSALDKTLRESLQLEIKRLHQRLGITFIYVTHDQREALVMSDRVSVMNQGRIEQIAAPAVIYDAPANRFVASFVGEANFLSIGTDLRAPGQSGAGSSYMVRPEKMRVGLPGPDDNTLVATVREVVFMGEMTRYLLETDSGATLVVKQTNHAGQTASQPGERTAISWAVADTRLVD